jgi:hypothetical protein
MGKKILGVLWFGDIGILKVEQDGTNGPFFYVGKGIGSDEAFDKKYILSHGYKISGEKLKEFIEGNE